MAQTSIPVAEILNGHVPSLYQALRLVKAPNPPLSDSGPTSPEQIIAKIQSAESFKNGPLLMAGFLQHHLPDTDLSRDFLPRNTICGPANIQGLSTNQSQPRNRTPSAGVFTTLDRETRPAY